MRLFRRLALSVALVGLPVIHSAAAHADGTTSITAPPAGHVFTSGTTATVTAFAGDPDGDTLQVTDPAGTTSSSSLGSKGTTLNLTVPIPLNGTYKVQLAGTPGASEEFTVRIPPTRPTGLSVGRLTGTLVVSWNQGPEPDLGTYQVSATGAATVDGSCKDGTCMAWLTTTATGTLSVVVTANRAGGVSSSSSTTVYVPAPSKSPSPSPTPRHTSQTPAPGQTTPPSAGGLSTPGPLSPSPGSTNPPLTLPSVAAAPDNSSLPIPLTAPSSRLTSSTTRGTDPSTMRALYQAEFLAAAFVLFLGSAHFGTWTRRRRRRAQLAAIPEGRTRIHRARTAIANAEAAARSADAVHPSKAGD